MASTATYAYCLVYRLRRPSTRQAPGGLPGATPPEAVEAGRSLWLIVAEVPLGTYGPGALESALRDLHRVAEMALAHERVIDHFFRQSGATVIPMTLFTMFSSRARAIEDVHRRTGIAAILERIRGCEEWGVRITRSGGGTAARQAQQRSRSGTAFLTARKQARDRFREEARRATGAAEEAFALLAEAARESKTRTDMPEDAPSPPLLDAAFLVPANRQARFRALAARAAARCRESGSSLVVTGPWPPYNFVQQEGNDR